METESSSPHSQQPATSLSILRQIDPVHAPHPTSLRSIFNTIIILPATSGSSECFLPSVFPLQSCIRVSSVLLRATCPAHLSFTIYILREILKRSQKIEESNGQVARVEKTETCEKGQRKELGGRVGGNKIETGFEEMGFQYVLFSTTVNYTKKLLFFAC